MSFDIENFNVTRGFLIWLITFGGFTLIALMAIVIGLLAAKGMRGPGIIVSQLRDGVRDFLTISPRRIWAVSMLTIKESIRRKALLIFIVFALLFMFAGWFMPTTDIQPEMQVKNYVSVVLQRGIPWLVLPLALLLSCWGLPEDIRTRALHTVVTKPIRRNEILMGRMLGFITVGTFVVVVMGVVGYFWVMRQVPDEARSSLICRVPEYGGLQYLTREGVPGDPINVGYIWEHRGYIEGATKGRAIWDFDGVSPDMMVDIGDNAERLLLESRFEAFRTHKGDMNRTLLCQMELTDSAGEHPPVALPAFEVQEFAYNITPVSRELEYYDEASGEMKQVDLFDDIVKDGRLRVVVQALDPGQYLGMAQPDLFIRTPDKAFAVGYSKALIGIWLMMALITILGVTASCFLKGPVAALLTGTFILVGMSFHEFLNEIVSGKLFGGGALENAVRIVEHRNVFDPLDEGWTTTIIQFVDKHIIYHGLWLVAQIIPDFSYFRMSPYVANGFDVSWGAALLPSIAITLAYAVPCLLIGYYSLKLRELETK